MSNLAARFLTAAVLVPILLVGMLLLPPWVTLVLTAIATAIGSDEVLGLFGHERKSGVRIVGAMIGPGLLACAYAYSSSPRLLLATFVAAVMLALLLGVMCKGEAQVAGRKMYGLVVAALYPSVFLALAPIIRRDSPDGGWWVVLPLATAFLSDTGAYFAGRFLGRHKLAPRLSPKKTIEGSAGGLAGGVAANLIACFLILDDLPALHAVALGIAGSAIGQIGDLVESLMKRASDIKDAGKVFPGHGGMMDRIDAAVFVIAFYYAYLLARGMM